jgi:pimeloyl-ACP methyl ester carboxylesterase
LPEGYRAISPDNRGYGEAELDTKIDATRGLRDFSDDLRALLDYLQIEKAHFVGHSLGGNILWQFMMDYPQRMLSVTQVAPGSPYGFGCTKDVNGTPCWDDFAGSGAGLINPELVKRIQNDDRTRESMFSPLNVFRNVVVKPPFIAEHEDALVSGLLSTHIGERDYPGDATPSSNYPFSAPGVWGANNALSPKYNRHVDQLSAITPKPPVLWLRGADDGVVSDAAGSDAGVLGMAGYLPNYPGADVYPPQPMLQQIRAVLDRYTEAGGTYTEAIITDCGHSPYIEKPDEFNSIFHKHIGVNN